MSMKIFWNGVGLALPRDWELVRIGKNRLTFQQGNPQVVEIQWRRGDASIKFPAVVEKWKRTCRKRGDLLSPIQFPKDLSRAVDVEWDGFEWKNDGYWGVDILRFCRRCHTLTDVRWTVSSNISERESIPWADIRSMLDGFSDHEPAVGIRFSIYDIEVIVPQDFRLETFSFHPGVFELQFQAERGNIRFLRWSAAAERLRSSSLESFGEAVCGRATWTTRSDPSIGDARIAYPKAQGWLGRILPSGNRSWFLIRFDRETDRILGVQYRGKTVHTDADILRFGRMFSIRQ